MGRNKQYKLLLLLEQSVSSHYQERRIYLTKKAPLEAFFVAFNACMYPVRFAYNEMANVIKNQRNKSKYFNIILLEYIVSIVGDCRRNIMKVKLFNKKVFSIILSVIMLISVIPVGTITASAATSG